MSKSIEQSIKAKVRQISEAETKPFNEVWNALIIERFLARLSHSNYKADFILKGGQLLAQYIELRRQTRDLDFLIRNVNQIEGVFKSIMEVETSDGFTFKDVQSSLLTQEHMKYPGLRINTTVLLGGTKTKLTIDIGFGDIVSEHKLKIPLLKTPKASLFEDSISLQVYPPEFIFSEKLETAVNKGAINSRMKDYHDIYLLINAEILDIQKLSQAIRQTFKNRKTEITRPPLSFKPEALKDLEVRWKAHLRGLGEETILPKDVSDVIDHINEYMKKIL